MFGHVFSEVFLIVAHGIALGTRNRLGARFVVRTRQMLHQVACKKLFCNQTLSKNSDKFGLVQSPSTN